MKMLKDKKNRKLRIISFVILFLAAIVFLAPYFWMLSNSFKSTKEILLEPTNMLPKQFTLDGEEVEIKEEDDSPENTSEIIVDNSEDNVSDDVENK